MAKKCLVEGITDGIHFKSKESKIMAMQLLFTEKQANAILEMRLYKLIGLELDALIKEHDQTMANIFKYEDILERQSSMTQVIAEELKAIKKEYATERKTLITNEGEAVYEEKKMEEMDVYVLMDRFGYVKAIDLPTYERNIESIKEESKFVVLCKNTGKVCLFSDNGMLYTAKVSDIPLGKIRDKGIPIDNITTYTSNDSSILLLCSQSDLNLFRMIFVSKLSYMKVVDGGEFDVTRKTIQATKLMDDDRLCSVSILNEQKNIVLVSDDGYFLKFPIEQIPEKKKGAVGVRGMKLNKDCRIDKVFYTGNATESVINYNDNEIPSSKIKLANRDSKGTKLRL